MYFDETYYNYQLPGPRDNDDISKNIDSNVKVANNIFQKCTFLADMLVYHSLSKTIWFLILQTNVIIVLQVFQHEEWMVRATTPCT